MKPVFLTCLLLLSACTPEKRSEFKGKLRAPDSPKFDEAFWKTWADGQAELSSYDLKRSKYGAGRTGTAVAIFVTETFSNILRVKADPGNHPKQDEIPVMKLNLVEDFQTGVYDYNLMLSTFVNTQTAGGILGGSPIKVSFSSQEWCGHIYKQALFDGPGVRVTSHSYFDGEADQEKTVDPIEDGVAEDGLLLWARGMARPVLKPGESKSVDLFSALETARQAQGPGYWTKATLTRSAVTEKVTVPLGTFEVERFEADIAGKVKKTFLVEKSQPHRVIFWETSLGTKASLVKSDRMKYWELNSPKGENALKRLGLQRRPARTM